MFLIWIVPWNNQIINERRYCFIKLFKLIKWNIWCSLRASAHLLPEKTFFPLDCVVSKMPPSETSPGPKTPAVLREAAPCPTGSISLEISRIRPLGENVSGLGSVREPWGTQGMMVASEETLKPTSIPLGKKVNSSCMASSTKASSWQSSPFQETPTPGTISWFHISSGLLPAPWKAEYRWQPWDSGTRNYQPTHSVLFLS